MLFHKKSGFTLIEALTAAAIGGIVVLGSMHLYSRVRASADSLASKGEVIDIRGYIRNQLHCPTTLGAVATCATSETTIAGKDAQGNTFLNTPYEILGGEYAVRAKCGPSLGTGRMKLEIRQLSASERSLSSSDISALPYWTDLNRGIPVKCTPAPAAGSCPLTPSPPIVDFSATGQTVCGLDATGKGYCWGSHIHGGMGVGDATLCKCTTKQTDPVSGQQVPVYKCSPIPQPVDTTLMTGSKVFVSIKGAMQNVSQRAQYCGLSTDQKLYCWGAGSQGGTRPKPVDMSNVTGSLAIADYGTTMDEMCFITTDGKMYCWGDNSNGIVAPLIGDYSKPTLRAATLPAGQRWVKLAMLRASAYAKTNTGVWYSWGQNGGGSVGILLHHQGYYPTTPYSIQGRWTTPFQIYSNDLLAAGGTGHDLDFYMDWLTGPTAIHAAGRIYTWANGPKMGRGTVGTYTDAFYGTMEINHFGPGPAHTYGYTLHDTRARPVVTSHIPSFPGWRKIAGQFEKKIQLPSGAFTMASKIYAVANDGKTYAWGGDYTDHKKIILYPQVYDAVADGLPSQTVDRISSYNHFGCATSGGRVYCKGSNFNGYLGAGHPIPDSGMGPDYPFSPVGN